MDAAEQAQRFRVIFERVRSELAKVVVGQQAVVDGVLTALATGGHVLLEGVPGIGKTLLVRTLGEALTLDFSRIQFTPDLMPADIQGTMVLVEKEGGGHELQFQQGPLIANLVLADEINRATPKTQSALLEAMQEKQISIGERVIKLDEPYCVMATQNPVEQEGTYPLPEAQLDRFLLKLLVSYPQEDEYASIIDRTTGANDPVATQVATPEDIREMGNIAREVAVPEATKTYVVRLIMATQPGSEYAPEIVNDNVSVGSSPRGAQALILTGKVQALLNDRYAVSTDDIKRVLFDATRHRLVLNFRAQANRVTADDILKEVLESVAVPHSVS